MIIELIAAFIGTVSFSVIFKVANKHCAYCGLTGAFAWFVYKIALGQCNSVIAATFISCFALTVMARFLSAKRKAPTTIFLLTGIFVLVPGAGMYYTTFNIFMNRSQEAANHGMLTIKTALAIAFGIVFAYILPPKLFGWGKKTSV